MANHKIWPGEDMAKLTIWVPVSIRDALKRRATKEGTSMSQVAVKILLKVRRYL